MSRSLGSLSLVRRTHRSGSLASALSTRPTPWGGTRRGIVAGGRGARADRPSSGARDLAGAGGARPRARAGVLPLSRRAVLRATHAMPPWGQNGVSQLKDDALRDNTRALVDSSHRRRLTFLGHCGWDAYLDNRGTRRLWRRGPVGNRARTSEGSRDLRHRLGKCRDDRQAGSRRNPGRWRPQVRRCRTDELRPLLADQRGNRQLAVTLHAD